LGTEFAFQGDRRGRDVPGQGDRPFVPLEVRIECVNQLAGLREESFQRLFGRRPIGERYEEGSWEIHRHVVSRDPEASHGLCFLVRQSNRDAGSSALHAEDVDRPMLVFVGDGAETPKPLRSSLVRLQRLDCSRVGFVHAPKEFASEALEVLRPLHDRKLRSLDLVAGVEDGELVDEVFERGPQALREIPDYDPDLRGWKRWHEWGDCLPLDLYEAGFFVPLHVGRALPLELG
jgi:hypothetical protein